MLRRLLILLLTLSSAVVAQIPRQQAVLEKEYDGIYDAHFRANFDRVRLLVRQSQLEVSSRLGLLNYQEGFQYPLTVRFADSAPEGIENALAYVQLRQATTTFQQDLVVNLAALVQDPMDFDRVFYHEMTHAVMNDAAGGAASMKIPRWVQEGLAVYVSGEGDDRVKALVGSMKRSHVRQLITDLDSLPSAGGYCRYYLAIRYLHDQYSINAVQTLVRDLVNGKTIDEAILDATGLSLDDFYKSTEKHALKTYENLAVPDYLYSPRAKSLNKWSTP